MRDTSRAQPGGRHGAPGSGATSGRRARTTDAPRRSVARGHAVRRFGGLLATLAVGGLLATLALAPVGPAVVAEPTVADSITAGSLQRVAVHEGAIAPGLSKDSYVASTGPETLVSGGTNHDWAKLVLVEGGFPVTDANVAVITQWMREENGPDNWWNRNNPLNNGNGSGGGSGLGSYATLQVGAHYAADSLRRLAFYDGIEAGLDAGTDAGATAAAIWSSPWATSHYGNGSHWTTSPVPVVEAPPSAWGR